jgi:hypothetical protein
VVVADFETIGCILIPRKTDAVLSIDSDAKFPNSIAYERFKAIARRFSELIDAGHPSDNGHFSASNVMKCRRENSTRRFGIFAVVDIFGTRISKMRHNFYNAYRYILSSLGRGPSGPCL